MGCLQTDGGIGGIGWLERLSVVFNDLFQRTVDVVDDGFLVAGVVFVLNNIGIFAVISSSQKDFRNRSIHIQCWIGDRFDSAKIVFAFDLGAKPFGKSCVLIMDLKGDVSVEIGH